MAHDVVPGRAVSSATGLRSPVGEGPASRRGDMPAFVCGDSPGSLPGAWISALPSEGAQAYRSIAARPAKSLSGIRDLRRGRTMSMRSEQGKASADPWAPRVSGLRQDRPLGRLSASPRPAFYAVD